MFQPKDRRPLRPQISVGSAVVLYHTVGLLLLARCSEGQFQVIGPPQPIVTVAGDDILLPCHLEPAVDAVSMAVEWTRPDLSPRFVHTRRGGQDLLDHQNPTYEGRTSVFNNKLKLGDVSLKLSRVKFSDAGTYRCFIPGLNRDAVVQLIVGAVSSPVIVGIDRVSSGVMLDCETKGWYPEPEVLWLDAEGNLLSAGPTETVRGPDDLYTVSSRLTVEKRHSNNFTCRVQQKDINQTRETEIQIQDEVFMAPSCSAVRIIVVLFVCLLLFSSVFLVFWKLRQNKGQNKMNHDKGSEEGEGEQLVRGNTEMKDLDEEKLQEKEEEEKDLIHVISVLMDQLKELEIFKDKHISQLEEVEEKWRKNEKNLESEKSSYNWNKADKMNSLLVDKLELENKKTEYRNSLQNIVERLKKINAAIKRITERKKKVENQIEQIKKQLEETKRRRHEIQLQSDQPEREETDKHTDSSALPEGP